jgi:ubiquinone/menaquinone biosynthesis C-methylase UbiE
MPTQDLPDYAPRLEAYQRSRERELRAIIRTLPTGERGLDVACGGGRFTAWLAEERGYDVAGVDLDAAYLRRAAGRNGRQACVLGDAHRLPFADGAFDLTFCAQSFYSLPDPLRALDEMRRVTSHGGYVAVLEQDAMHEMMLPWPPGLELAIRQAQLTRWQEQHGCEGAEKFYAARRMGEMFAETGLADAEVTTHVVERSAPLGNDEARYLHGYLQDLWRRLSQRLPADVREQFRALTDPVDPAYLLNQRELHVAQLEVLTLARKR